MVSSTDIVSALASAANVIEFYSLRETLPSHNPEMRRNTLVRMRRLEEREISQCGLLSDLCQDDPRLGFHSEAEGYKYFSEKLEWRKAGLEKLLAEEFPHLEREMDSPLLWPSYTGAKLEGKTYLCGREPGEFAAMEELYPTVLSIGSAALDPPATRWRATHNGKEVVIEVECRSITPSGRAAVISESIQVLVEPRRMWPVARFERTRSGKS